MCSLLFIYLLVNWLIKKLLRTLIAVIYGVAKIAKWLSQPCKLCRIFEQDRFIYINFTHKQIHGKKTCAVVMRYFNNFCAFRINKDRFFIGKKTIKFMSG